jgi:hypothetical protein
MWMTPSSEPTTLHTPTGDFTFATKDFIAHFYSRDVTTTHGFHFGHNWSLEGVAGIEERVQ